VLSSLRKQVAKLRGVQFPRAKLHGLFEASLEASRVKAERLVREVFSRCKPDQRKVLWDIVAEMGRGQEVDFPWRKANGRRDTVIADLVEAIDLFPEGYRR
jgi:hypothetical protein